MCRGCPCLGGRRAVPGVGDLGAAGGVLAEQADAASELMPLTPEGRAFLQQTEQHFLEALGEIKRQNDEQLRTQLEEERTALREQAAGLDRRYRVVARGLLLMVVITIVAAIGGIVWVDRNAETQATSLASATKESRERSARIACESRNDQNRAIIRFIGTRDPGLRRRALRRFPREPNCQAYAERVTRLP
jgi:hypothetical protein